MNYTIELKETILKKYKNGRSVASLIREYEIPRSTIYNWIDLHIERDLTHFKTSKHKILNVHIPTLESHQSDGREPRDRWREPFYSRKKRSHYFGSIFRAFLEKVVYSEFFRDFDGFCNQKMMRLRIASLIDSF